MPLIYTSVSKGTTTLAEYAAFAGNFGSVAKDFLEKASAPRVRLASCGPGRQCSSSPADPCTSLHASQAGKNEGKFTYQVDGHTFNFLTKGGYSECRPGSSWPLRRPLRAPQRVQRAPGPFAGPVLTARPCAAYLVVADDAYGRTIPSAFLDKMEGEFATKYSDKAASAKEGGLTSSYGCAADGQDGICSAGSSGRARRGAFEGRRHAALTFR